MLLGIVAVHLFDLDEHGVEIVGHIDERPAVVRAAGRRPRTATSTLAAGGGRRDARRLRGRPRRGEDLRGAEPLRDRREPRADRPRRREPRRRASRAAWSSTAASRRRRSTAAAGAQNAALRARRRGAHGRHAALPDRPVRGAARGDAGRGRDRGASSSSSTSRALGGSTACTTRGLGRIYGVAARPDFIAAIAALLGVLVFDTLPGLFIGIARLAAAAPLPRLAAARRRARPACRASTASTPTSTRHPDNRAVPGVVVLRVESGLFFANADAVRDRDPRAAPPRARRAIVLDAETIPFIDVTAAQMLAELADDLDARRHRRCCSRATSARCATCSTPTAPDPRVPDRAGGRGGGPAAVTVGLLHPGEMGAAIGDVLRGRADRALGLGRAQRRDGRPRRGAARGRRHGRGARPPQRHDPLRVPAARRRRRRPRGGGVRRASTSTRTRSRRPTARGSRRSCARYVDGGIIGPPPRGRAGRGSTSRAPRPPRSRRCSRDDRRGGRRLRRARRRVGAQALLRGVDEGHAPRCSSRSARSRGPRASRRRCSRSGALSLPELADRSGAAARSALARAGAGSARWTRSRTRSQRPGSPTASIARPPRSSGARRARSPARTPGAGALRAAARVDRALEPGLVAAHLHTPPPGPNGSGSGRPGPVPWRRLNAQYRAKPLWETVLKWILDAPIHPTHSTSRRAAVARRTTSAFLGRQE